MISKGCMTATWDQPKIRWENTSNHAVKEGKESVSKWHVKINKFKIQYYRITSSSFIRFIEIIKFHYDAFDKL